MKKKIMNNLVLKIFSVVIAILVWLIIANVNDPVVTKTYSIPVNIQNRAYIESMGKTYLVDEDQLTATVILRGHSSLVEGRVNDIQAIADLTQIVDMNTTPYVMVPISVSCEGVQTESIMVVPKTVQVKIEDVESKEFVVTVNPGETKPASGFEIGSTLSNPEKITVKGPSSLINIIDRITANIDVNKLSENVTKTSYLKIIDKNQSEFSETQMSYLKFDELAEPVVDVNIDLWKVRNDVELKVNFSGAPGLGYEVTELAVTPSKISIAGTDEALQVLSENNNIIEIPAETVVASGQTEDFETKIDLSSLLPPDTKLLTGDVESAIVHATVMPMGSKQFIISTNNIKVENLNEKLKLVFDKDKITVRVTGDSDSLNLVNENTVQPVIDLAGKERGEHTLNVNLMIPEGCQLLEGINVLVQLVELE